MAKTLPARRPRSLSTRQALVRMYQSGLGDCFLVRLPKTTGGTFNILIDCGVIGVATDARSMMNNVVADIATVCERHVDLVIVTHEHWDHVSGFSTQQAESAFDGLAIDAVWYAWTEDPSNALGTKLRAERAAKVKATKAAAEGLRGVGLGTARAERIESILQFFGLEPEDGGAGLATGGRSNAIGKTRAAFDYLKNRRDVAVEYRYPSKPPLMLAGVEGVRLTPPARRRTRARLDDRLLRRRARRSMSSAHRSPPPTAWLRRSRGSACNPLLASVLTARLNRSSPSPQAQLWARRPRNSPR